MKLGTVIRKWRLMTERSLRDVSHEIGISPATLLRVEQGRDFDGRVFAIIFRWLTSDSTGKEKA